MPLTLAGIKLSRDGKYITADGRPKNGFHVFTPNSVIQLKIEKVTSASSALFYIMMTLMDKDRVVFNNFPTQKEAEEGLKKLVALLKDADKD